MLEDLRATLVERLGQVLGGYVNPVTGRMGMGLVGLMGGVGAPMFSDFSLGLVRAA